MRERLNRMNRKPIGFSKS
ncbi:hypothetical protein [Photobacterium proteolyticum]